MHTPKPQKNLLAIAIPSPLRQIFHYANTENQPLPETGVRISVPFGNQKAVVGVLVDSAESAPANIKPRPIHEILDQQPALTQEILALCEWCAHYYHYPLGEVCHLALPALLRKPVTAPETEAITLWQLTPKGAETTLEDFTRAKKQAQAWQVIAQKQTLTSEEAKQAGISTAILKALLEKDLIEKTKQHVAQDLPPDYTQQTVIAQAPPALNTEQTQALTQIEYDAFNSYLLDGVTGSGKTEVYLQAIEQVLQQGKQALVLVPEIGLTPQTLQRFEQRFTVPIGTLHSGITDKQRFSTWQKAKQGLTPIIIGTRSAIFTPFPNLGLIIVDEEHDLSYKQQEGVRYSAKDLAIIRAQKKNIPIILGSATPSLETLHNALQNRFAHLRLTERATATTLPEIRCIDYSRDDIAPEILSAISQTLEQKQQVLVFINRRGYAPTLMCRDCGWINQCQHCDSRMTLHQQRGKRYLHCHHCDAKAQVPAACPHCHSSQLAPIGSGTQRNEELLKEHFKNTPIFRIDRDSTNRKGYMEATLESVNQSEACILVGTQMLAKGHHFSRVALVVVLGMDNSFFSSDFRGAERMGQLLTQVAGRAGREQHQGSVLIQTQFANHPLLLQLINGSYSVLAQQLLPERELTQMPPYQHIAMIRCHAQQADMAIQFLQQTRHIIEQWQTNSSDLSCLECIGPLPALIEKRNNRYYYQLQIKSAQRAKLHQLLTALCQALEKQRTPRGLHWLVDVDPQEA